jgi:hypothetical protein
VDFELGALGPDGLDDVHLQAGLAGLVSGDGDERNHAVGQFDLELAKVGSHDSILQDTPA